MPTIYKNTCKTCDKSYKGYGKIYCSPTCRDTDPEMHRRRLANRTGIRCSPTTATKKKISQSVKRWHKEVGTSQETRRKLSANFSGPLNPRWKGGEIQMGGYWYIWQPHHLRSNVRGYVKRAILVAEKCLGRFLNGKEIIHHIDSNPSNDVSGNLYLFPNEPTHRSFHSKYQGSGLKGKKPPLLQSNLSKQE